MWLFTDFLWWSEAENLKITNTKEFIVKDLLQTAPNLNYRFAFVISYQMKHKQTEIFEILKSLNRKFIKLL